MTMCGEGSTAPFSSRICGISRRKLDEPACGGLWNLCADPTCRGYIRADLLLSSYLHNARADAAHLFFRQ